MKEYKLIAFDMDGTLLTSGNTISPRVWEALDRAVDAGKTVVICTGRSYRELIDYDERELGRIRYYICENGSLLYDSVKKEVISSVCIPEDLVRHVLLLANREGVMVYLASEGHNMLNREDALRMEDFHAGRYKDIELKSGILCEDLIQSWLANPVPVEKMNLYASTVGIRDELYGKLQQLPVSIVPAEETGLELTALHVSKGAGFLKLCEYLGISAEDAIAVGDSDNDTEMLKAAGLAVAMGNARACVKEVSDVTVADNDHDGCAEVIDKYLLGGESLD